MSAEEYRFRGAAFGFNRRDVIGYIERVHKEYAARLKELEQALEAERAARSAVEQQQSLAGQEAAAAGEDAQRAKVGMAEAQAALDEVRRERDELRLRLQSTRQELSDLQATAAQMAPAAQAYEALKDKAAGIELEARGRAEAIIRDGERQADQKRQEVAAWMRRVESSYARVKSDVAATLAHAVSEMERTGRSLDGVTQELEGHGDQLRAMAREYTTRAEAKPVKPDAGR